jgi:hypothetical protein
MQVHGETARALTAGERVGIWLGLFGWLIAFALITLPDTLDFAGPLGGGAALSLGLALALQAVARRRPAPPAVLGVTAVAVSLLLIYYSLFFEPVLEQHPEIVRRLHSLGSVTHVPVWVGLAVLVVGLVVCARCGRPRREKGARMR